MKISQTCLILATLVAIVLAYRPTPRKTTAPHWTFNSRNGFGIRSGLKSAAFTAGLKRAQLQASPRHVGSIRYNPKATSKTHLKGIRSRRPVIQDMSSRQMNARMAKNSPVDFGKMTNNERRKPSAARSGKLNDVQIYSIVTNYLKQRQEEQDHSRSLLSSFGSQVAGGR